jgi:copper resistance protein C
MRPPAPRRLLGRVVAVVAVVAGVVGLLVPTGLAWAHTALDFALPAEGTTVAQPVSEISIGFTDVVALIGDGFEVLDPQGNLVVPFAVTDDDTIFRLQLDPPLAGGPVVVSYHVLSLDGHEVEGQVSFIAAAEPPPPVTAEPTTPAATTAPPASAAFTVAASSSTLVPTSTGPTSTGPASTGPASTAPETSPAPTAGDGDGDDSSDSNRNLLIGAVVAVVLGSAVLLVVRSRRTP